MTKRPRPEEGEIKWPVDSGQPGNEVNSGKRHEISKEELIDKLATVGNTVCKEETIVSAQVAVVEVAVAEVLGDGPFWSLLSQVGYSI